MTNNELTFHRQTLLALRADLLGDMTHMEDDSLKDRAKTISITTDKEELASDNADQGLTLTLLDSDEDILTRRKRRSGGSKTAAMAAANSVGSQSPRPAWMPSLMPQSVCYVLCNRKMGLTRDSARGWRKAPGCDGGLSI